MKKHLKRIMPKKLVITARRIKFMPQIHRENKYRKYRALHFSSSFNKKLNTYLAGLLITSHVLEKGITMPNRRLGFGYDRVRDIVKRCNFVIKMGGSKKTEFQAALCDLKQYLDIHKQENFFLPKDIEEDIEKLISHLTIEDKNCFTVTREEYFKPAMDFKEFAHQRHSVRWYSDKHIDDKILLEAIELAQTAPSACNRQATRVKIISSPEKKKLCCEIQHGNRGFAEKADKWLLITSEQGNWSYTDTNLAYIDAGIFTMNLLYALQYYGIVACTLNAQLDKRQQIELQRSLGYSKTEIPIVFIAMGMPTDEFMVAKSRRLETKGIIQEI